MTRARDKLPRLNTAAPMPLNMQQPQAMYSPALPTAIQYNAPLPLQTPMQQGFFNMQPYPGARPGHHSAHPSLAHFAAAGLPPPGMSPGFPMTPMGAGHFARGSISGMPGQPPYHGRNRRQPSIGGPPKAVLGGPQRKVSPLPPPTASPIPAPLKKKAIINLPKETIRDQDGKATGKAPWARLILDAPPIPPQEDAALVDAVTRKPYMDDEERQEIPPTIDVFLPGKSAWDNIRRMAIEEKLERMGVERGNGSAPPNIYAPHARAASISSPADPALLLFKLNKLQQAQGSSVASSPQPSYGMSPSPNSQMRVGSRHGYSMSMAPPSSQPMFNGPSFNPFGHDATLGSDYSVSPGPQAAAELYAPQGRVPMATFQSLAPPSGPPSARSTSQPDFARGFGLEVPDEAEEEAVEEELPTVEITPEDQEPVDGQVTDNEEDREEYGSIHGTATGQSQPHSRHTSKLSQALSLRSFGVFNPDVFNERTDIGPVGHEHRTSRSKTEFEGLDEWTGSDDAFNSEDDESLDEYSNPSDEERARQTRMERRANRKRMQAEDENPRRLPNFPRPPENTMVLPRGEDDIISNPSDEGEQGDYRTHNHFDHSSSNGAARPLPHIPNSRVPPGQESMYNPHSRQHSGASFGGYPDHRPTLNPNAKPFVFGAPIIIEPPRAPSGGFSDVGSVNGHQRAPSFGKPLNKAAPEFKPGNFSFKFTAPMSMPAGPPPPAPVPSLPVPAPYQHGLGVPDAESSPFRNQGREKRARHADDDESFDEGQSFASFKFPAETPRKEPPSPRPPIRSGHSSLNPSAEPFSLERFTAAANLATVPPIQRVESPSDLGSAVDDFDNTTEADYGADTRLEIFGQGSTRKRPPQLDVKPRNTVPAGIFKALGMGNGEERTRKNVRSRLSSRDEREFFAHGSRPSLDDENVAPIARKSSHARLPDQEDIEDVFRVPRHHHRRRSSLPDALHDPLDSNSDMSQSPIHPRRDISTSIAMNQIENMLIDKFDELRHALQAGASLHPKTEAMVSEVMAMFRSQLRDSAAKSLEDDQQDARGEFDIQLIRATIEEGHAETLMHLKRELASMSANLHMAMGRPLAGPGMPPGGSSAGLETLSARTIEAMSESISELSQRMESILRAAPARERDAVVDAVVSSLSPLLRAHQEPVDYEQLTSMLSQAVKPHISQLIDLASDKKETASLIVQALLPHLSHLQAVPVDTDAISHQLVAAVNRAIAPIDAFEIKEQVSDLVVERLDSRLANRDKALSADAIAEQVSSGVNQLLAPLKDVQASLKDILSSQQALSGVSDLPAKTLSAIEGLKKSQADLVANLPASSTGSTGDVLHVKSVVDALSEKQTALIEQTASVLGSQRELQQKVVSLPDTFATATQVLQDAHAAFSMSRDNVKREMDDMRKANTDLQVQVAKARGAHGQVRVEKEMLAEKLTLVEADRAKWRESASDATAQAASKTEEVAALTAKNAEMQDSLSKALARLQATDASGQAQQARIAELEKANQDLLFEKRTMKNKIDSLEVKAAYASRDNEVAEQTIADLRKEKAELAANSALADGIRSQAEQLETILGHLKQADNEELKELRRARDRSRALEGEHAALQKRFKEQEGRVSNAEKSAFTARSSLTQAQARASEWEKRAKEYEGKLELTQTRFEQIEAQFNTMEAESSVMQMQLEEREAQNRLIQDREAKQKAHIEALEAKIRTMQNEFEKARSRTVNPVVQRPIGRTNGYAQPPRPDSRASTAYDRSRSVTPNGKSLPGLYDSIHAPKATRINGGAIATTNGLGATNGLNSSVHAPRYPASLAKTSAAARNAFMRAQAPSPTPSTVSAAPTVDADGWYSFD